MPAKAGILYTGVVVKVTAAMYCIDPVKPDDDSKNWLAFWHHASP